MHFQLFFLIPPPGDRSVKSVKEKYVCVRVCAYVCPKSYSTVCTLIMKCNPYWLALSVFLYGGETGCVGWSLPALPSAGRWGVLCGRSRVRCRPSLVRAGGSLLVPFAGGASGGGLVWRGAGGREGYQQKRRRGLLRHPSTSIWTSGVINIFFYINDPIPQ